MISDRWSLAHDTKARIGVTSDSPSGVRAYSTLGGMVGYMVRVRMPFRSRSRTVSVSILWLIPLTFRLSSEKRRGPS